ncbi:MAG: hypothetical protein PHS80_02590 [Methanothrix sp.]|nr:hypothetical protein [Methanothrix sp.]
MPDENDSDIVEGTENTAAKGTTASDITILHPITKAPVFIVSGNNAAAQAIGIYSSLEANYNTSASPSSMNFLVVAGDYDVFYHNIIKEINLLYYHDHFIPLAVMIRKLIENLIIDILRSRYGLAPPKSDLYFNANIGRHQPLSVLLKNLETNINDFNLISSTLNVPYIKRMIKCKKEGDKAAHSIDTNIKKEWFDRNKDEINHVINLLMYIFIRI